MIAYIKKLCLSESGATAVEYGLVLALIAISALVAINGVSEVTIGMWNDVADEVTNVS
ncbi:Flp family type IVb pilin [Parasphingorhabdus flavimaris]|jgi:pilus assembly protein Flp/PilA|uniref:Flp family type IVb pilin n=1 Tax=Parasphingorhabdus flavimaris TaxID=266812 RepID=A0ABX2MZI1_9SPHN|nr:Flp family type IVb pilin [Parasphingorhabdus flavimaris]NVD26766.1 Flp family type IVb pilin [Parasphingorhabdus flavimaris]|tara:strand:- start:12642 stop:12815 length:174 start_codon:yes stop_codon:yes gene_type:complete